MTDENGYFSSASDYTKHSKDTNSGQSESGVWFGTNSNGESVEVNDAYGAFPYDTYRLEELRCEENVDKVLYKGTFRISGTGMLLILGQYLIQILQLQHQQKMKQPEHIIQMQMKSNDHRYRHLYRFEKGQEYVMKGTLMDRKTGK